MLAHPILWLDLYQIEFTKSKKVSNSNIRENFWKQRIPHRYLLPIYDIIISIQIYAQWCPIFIFKY